MGTRGIADDETGTSDERTQEPADDHDSEDQSFSERVEDIREKRAEEGDRREKMEEMMGGGGPGMGGGTLWHR